MKVRKIHLSVRALVMYVISLALGVGLHALFERWPSIVTEFFSPVNESIWEHVKIVFWPLLLLLSLLYGRERRGETFAAALAASVLMLLLGWVYYFCLGGTMLAVDLVIYAFVMALGFLLPALVTFPEGWDTVAAALVILFITLIFAFTIMPPKGLLFRDTSLAGAWVQMTC